MTPTPLAIKKLRHRLWSMPRDAFPGYDEPVNIEGDPEDVLKVLLGDEVTVGDTDTIEPVLDE